MAKRAPKLTQGEIHAICEALGSKLAGPISESDGDYPREFYETAHRKMSERMKGEA
jgi:hypothetical protein